MFYVNAEDEDGASSDQPVDTKTKPTDKKATEAKKPIKNIDDIKNFKEMLALFELLGLPFDSENLNLAEMKKEAKAKIEEQSSGSGQYSNGTTVILRCLRNTLDTCLIYYCNIRRMLTLI